MPKPAQPNAAALAGNWLIYGALPPPPVVAFGSSQPKGLAVSIDVIGTSLVATASVQSQCGSVGSLEASYGGVLTGTVAADGTFTLATPATQNAAVPALTIQGTAPASTSASWSGSYSFTLNAATCVANDKGTFLATPIQDVTGAYTGTTSILATGASVSVTANLQQGGASPISSTTGVSSKSALSGTLQITGFSCFTKGVASSGLVEGDRAFTIFTMEDGSTLTMTGYLLDVNASRLSVPSLMVLGGKCNGSYANPFTPLVLQR